jgi:nitroreductase
MDILEAITSRRTIRKFSAPPTPEQLQRVLKAGGKAPSAGNRQAWFVVVVNDDEKKDKLAEYKISLFPRREPETDETRAMRESQKEVFKNCTTLIFYTHAPEIKFQHRYNEASVWLCVENLCLAAVAEGLGTQIFAYWDEGEANVNKLLGVPEDYTQITGVQIGTPHPEYEPRKITQKPQNEWVFMEKWPAA